MLFPITILLTAAQVQHPVYPPTYSAGQVEGLKESVAQAMEMTPRELYGFVPGCSGIYYCGCPNCDGGSQEHAVDWTLGLGDTVKCKYCGMEFPNEQFPNNREKVIVAPSGVRQVYRWHESLEGRQFFFEARAWYARWGWTRDMAEKLANLHALTGDAAYGDRAAVIVGRYAQVYPDYAIRFDYPFQPVRFWPAEQKWPYDKDIAPFRGAKFYWWGYGDIPEKLTRAYDLLAAGNSFERMRGLLGDGIRERIEEDLIRLGYEFVAANPDSHGNMSPGMYTDMIEAGRIIGAPDMVHEGVKRFKTLLGKRFFSDGWWSECAPSYHWQTVGNMREVANAARGYSDPADWPEPRFEDLDLMKEAPLLARAYKVGMQGVLPNGRSIPVNDTWWTTRKNALDQSPCRLWPGMALAVLGAGSGEGQFQLAVNWNASYGHTHMDSGAIILFAHGKELLSDIGYTHTRYRNWTINSASHNMVVVDQQSQNLQGHASAMTGNVLFLDTRHPHVSAIELDVQPAYPQCSVYRRRLVHVHVDEGTDFVVDRFDVAGGKTHDYFLWGCADEDGTFSTSADLPESVTSLVPFWGGTVPHTGENCIDTVGKKHHPYVFLREIRAGQVDAPFSAAWRYGEIGLTTHIVPEPGSTLHAVKAPSVRRAGREDGKLEDYMMDGVMLRHSGEKSTFLAVHAPFRGSPVVESVGMDGATVIVTSHGAAYAVAWEENALSVRGPSWEYNSGTPRSGTLRATDGASLITDGAAPAASYIRLDFGGQRSIVYAVVETEGNRVTLEHHPGFELTEGGKKAQFMYFPGEELPGPVAWTAWE